MKTLILLLLFLSLTACSGFETRVGYQIKYATIEKIQVGSMSKKDIIDLIGYTPNMKAGFNENIWYYVYENKSMFNNLKERQILELKFDSSNNLESKNILTEKNAIKVRMDSSGTRTETESAKGSWIKRLFAGVG